MSSDANQESDYSQKVIIADKMMEQKTQERYTEARTRIPHPICRRIKAPGLPPPLIHSFRFVLGHTRDATMLRFLQNSTNPTIHFCTFIYM